jgi:hypothetical protein
MADEELGRCCFGSSATNCEDGWTQDACARAGGTWQPSNSERGCAVRTILARSLGDNILKLGETYRLTYDFRDKVLTKSSTGKRMLKHYYDNSEELFRIVRDDIDILAACIKAWHQLWPFVCLIVDTAEAKPQSRTNTKTRLRFDDNRQAVVADIVNKFRVASKDRRLKKALDDFEREVGKYARLSPEEALQLLLGGKETSRK